MLSIHILSYGYRKFFLIILLELKTWSWTETAFQSCFLLLLQVCGTPTYVAPEILAETGYGVKVDVWATGVIMYILLVGFPPFSSRTNNQEELFDQILSGLFEFNSPDWDDISFSAKELISWMLQVDPLQRFSAYEILEHPWIKELD